MAESEGQERTEQPTPKRLNEARQRGQVARSRELTTTFVLIGSSVGLIAFGHFIINGLFDVMRHSFSIRRDDISDMAFILFSFRDSIIHILISVVPFMAVVIISAVVGSIALSGWNFSVQALTPKFSKMNPLSGIKRMVGPQGLMELGKALAKFVVITGVGLLVLYGVSDKVFILGSMPTKQAIVNAGSLILWAFLLVSLSMIIISAVDAPFQLWNHKRQLRMTRQDVKQENKDTDGSPEVKQKIRRMQTEMAMRRMMQEVPHADVVITNPTHYAVAVRYDQARMRAPVVVAKGSDNVAFEIRRVASEVGVPILSAPLLARAIYHTTELNQEVPAGLYLAVAKVLAYIYHIKRTAGTYSEAHMSLDDLPIPDEMRFDDNNNDSH